MTGPTGRLDRPITTGTWDVPKEVRVAGDALEWSGERRPAKPSPKLLLDFLRLAQAPPEAIEKFARVNGNLTWRFELSGGHFPGDGSEPLWWWTAFSRDLSTLLKVAADVHVGGIGTAFWPELGATQVAGIDSGLRAELQRNGKVVWSVPTDSRTLYGSGPGGETPRQAVAHILDALLIAYGVRPHLEWDPNPVVTLLPGGLGGALVIQALFAVARTDGLAVCASCGTPYVPKRKPVAGRRTYCPACGLKAARREATRAFRERQRTEAAAGKGA